MDVDIPDQRRLRIAASEAEVEYQREVSIVDRDAGKVDETGDSLLRRRQSYGFSLSTSPYCQSWRKRHTLDSSESCIVSVSATKKGLKYVEQLQ
jgi:hypothetical protein